MGGGNTTEKHFKGGGGRRFVELYIMIVIIPILSEMESSLQITEKHAVYAPYYMFNHISLSHERLQ